MPLSRSLVTLPVLAAFAAVHAPADAESVRFNTVFGDFEVDLFEEETPGHVANFLAYVDAGDYDNNVIHRAAELTDGSEFVVQGGAFRYEGTPVSSPFELAEVESRGPVTNEPGISNTRGTLALARVGGQENSGTSQFFFNLQDNTGLDGVDGGFTVFGEVAGDDGLSILDQIAAVPTFRGAAPFGELPLRDFGAGDGVRSEFGADEFVLINSIVRVDIEDVPGTDPDEPGDGDVGDGDDDTPVDPGDPAVIPTPGAAAAGILGLASMALRRRRD